MDTALLIKPNLTSAHQRELTSLVPIRDWSALGVPL